MAEKTAVQTKSGNTEPAGLVETSSEDVAAVQAGNGVLPPRVQEKGNQKSGESEDGEEKKKKPDDDGESGDDLPEDPDDADDAGESDDDDDDDDDDDETWAGESGTEDENELIQLKPKEDSTLKNPQLTPQKIAEKKPKKEEPKGPEKTERSPWQQVMDFFLHGAKGAMIKNGDISLKESITDKLMVGLGFKSFKEDILLQQQAKKFWQQKAVGKKVDMSLLNTDRIFNRLRKEERQEKMPLLLKELAGQKQRQAQESVALQKSEKAVVGQKKEELNYARATEQARPRRQVESQNPLTDLTKSAYSFLKTPVPTANTEQEKQPQQQRPQPQPIRQDVEKTAPEAGLKSKISNAVKLGAEDVKAREEMIQRAAAAQTKSEAAAAKIKTEAVDKEKQQTAQSVLQKKEWKEDKRKEEAQQQQIRQVKHDFDNTSIIQHLALQAHMQTQALGQLNQARANMDMINQVRGRNNDLPPVPAVISRPGRQDPSPTSQTEPPRNDTSPSSQDGMNQPANYPELPINKPWVEQAKDIVENRNTGDRDIDNSPFYPSQSPGR